MAGDIYAFAGKPVSVSGDGGKFIIKNKLTVFFPPLSSIYSQLHQSTHLAIFTLTISIAIIYADLGDNEENALCTLFRTTVV